MLLYGKMFTSEIDMQHVKGFLQSPLYFESFASVHIKILTFLFKVGNFANHLHRDT